MAMMYQMQMILISSCLCFLAYLPVARNERATEDVTQYMMDSDMSMNC